MKCPVESSPTAAELLEATKKLYVKTDILRQRRIEPGEPRLFHFSDSEDRACYKLPTPPVVTPRIPSNRSAFTLIRKSSPQHRRNGEVQQRPTRSPTLVSTTAPLPYQRSTSLEEKDKRSHQETSDWKPIPKPRSSTMCSRSERPLEEHWKPEPKPRHKMFSNEAMSKDQIEVSDHNPICVEGLQNFSPSHRRKMITKSHSNLCAPSVAALKKRAHSTRPPTPVINNEEGVPAFPVMDESERDFLDAALRLTYSTDEEETPPSTPAGHLSFEKSCFLSSPTIDSGRPNSDDEDRRTHPCSTKSLDDGFFDSSFLRKEKETTSEATAAISNLQKEVGDCITGGLRSKSYGHNVSVLERNARIMRWVRGCEVSTPPS